MSSVVHSAASSKCAERNARTAAQFFEAKNLSSDPVAIQTEESDRCTAIELKHAEHFEDDDDNDNDSDDVEDVSVHGSWITRRYPRRQAIWSSRVISVFFHARRCALSYPE